MKSLGLATTIAIVIYVILLVFAPDVLAQPFYTLFGVTDLPVMDGKADVMAKFTAPEAVGGKGMDEGTAKAIYYTVPFLIVWGLSFLIAMVVRPMLGKKG